jgi:hypothetical protein
MEKTLGNLGVPGERQSLFRVFFLPDLIAQDRRRGFGHCPAPAFPALAAALEKVEAKARTPAIEIFSQAAPAILQPCRNGPAKINYPLDKRF